MDYFSAYGLFYFDFYREEMSMSLPAYTVWIETLFYI